MKFISLNSLNILKHYNKFDCKKVIFKYNYYQSLHLSNKSISVGVIGAPFSKGQSKRGTELAPKALIDAGLIEQLKLLGHSVTHVTNVNFNDNPLDNQRTLTEDKTLLKNAFTVADMSAKLSNYVKQVVNEGSVSITLGGDHSISVGSIFGNNLVNSDACVIWIDAHADINTVETTKSGHFHGMPVSFLLNELNSHNKSSESLQTIRSCISCDRFAYIGLRDIEPQEKNLIKKFNILSYNMADIDKIGINEVIARTLDKINSNLKKKIYVSFDIDAIDQKEAPSTGTAVPYGLTIREALSIGELISSTNLLCGIDMVEINPLIGNEEHVKATVNGAINILLAFFGKSRDMFVRNQS